MFNYSCDTSLTCDFYKEYLNLLFFKDIVIGVWNQTSSIEQAVFQLVYAIDLELALHSLLLTGKLEGKFKKLAQRISRIETVSDLKNTLQMIYDDISCIPVQREYRKICIFLLVNLLTLVYFNVSFADVSNIADILEVITKV